MPDQIAESEVNMQVWVATKVAPCKGMTWWLGAGGGEEGKALAAKASNWSLIPRPHMVGEGSQLVQTCLLQVFFYLTPTCK